MNELAIKKIQNGHYNILEEAKEEIQNELGNKILCADCNELEEYRIICKKENEDFILHNDFAYFVYFKRIQKIKCICKKCNNEQFINISNKYNKMIYNEEYRRKFNLIPWFIITQIPLKYNISEEDLSTILDLEENEFEKYSNGYITPPIISDFLLDIYNDSDLFMSYLKANKNKISSESYLKSYKATTYLIELEKQSLNNVLKRVKIRFNNNYKKDK